MQIPAKIPISNGKTRHATKAAIPGIKSVSTFDKNWKCYNIYFIIKIIIENENKEFKQFEYEHKLT